MLSSIIHVVSSQSHSPIKDVSTSISVRGLDKSMEVYLREVKHLFEASLPPRKLHTMSEKLQGEFHEKLQSSDISMLPSYHHTLPTGHERGTFLALDVGGSNFRLALIELKGRSVSGDGFHTKRNKCFAIDTTVRALQGRQFFDWIAERIEDMLAEDCHESDQGMSPLAMGLAWSFPIEQTSRRSGSLLTMGKGFNAINGVEGQDLCDLIMTPCRKRGLNVELQTIVNDSSATLLSQAYRDSSTRISLIHGTGTNAAVYLPVSALSSSKFGNRPKAWHVAAQHVLVNTELSMFGKSIIPMTRWDEQLNKMHSLPDFQVLEYKVGGRYLGEIVRLIVVEAVEECGLFDGLLPATLQNPYSLDTGTLAVFESDGTLSLSMANKAFQLSHPVGRDLYFSELRFIRDVAKLVSNRAAAYLATAVHALWSLRTTSKGSIPSQSEHVTIACNGTVMEKYPTLRSRCQDYLDELTVLSGAKPRTVTLEMAPESSIYGAAVAVSCLEN